MNNSDIKVWDPRVRLFHWGLVLSFALAWITAENWEDMHVWAGYAAASLIGFRLFWGLVGPKYARFTQFVRGSVATKQYARAMLHGKEPRYIGHNPLGGLMVLALLAGLSGTAWSGWMMTLAAYKRSEWLEEIHEVMAGFMLALVVIHIAGVAYASIRHNENLARAMVSGKKHSAGQDDVA
jgi:cytochrome b